VIELYAVVDHPGPPLPDVASLRAVISNDLAAVCGAATDGKVSPERLWHHEEIVEALMRDRDTLPFRYGTVLPDEDAAVRILRERHDELVGALARVRGAVEVAVRVMTADRERPGAGPPVSGVEYLRASAGGVAARAEAARAVDEPLATAARATVRRATGSDDELLRAAYLVDRDHVASFTDLVAELQRRLPALRLLCTGPWAPYSFAQR
jgi:Gas vesicle synthesis protein GvpL/GvpF